MNDLSQRLPLSRTTFLEPDLLRGLPIRGRPTLKTTFSRTTYLEDDKIVDDLLQGSLFF